MTLVVTFCGIILIPVAGAVVTIAVRWGRMNEALRQQNDANTRKNEEEDVRIRWLEENVWKTQGQRIGDDGDPAP